MNHIYRVIWNRSLRVWQAVSEAASSSQGVGGSQGGADLRPCHRQRAVAAAVALLMLGTGAAFATPANPRVVAGNAGVSFSNGNTTVTQQSNRAVIDWSSFSVGAGQVMQFLQPGKDSAVLNRVTGGSPSAIYGQIHANGSVFLINPDGVLVGPGGVIEAGSFVASTLNVGNAAFMAGGDLDFAGSSNAGVQNFGFVHADNGDVVLIGRSVANAGTLEAPQGAVALAAGSDVQLTRAGDDRVVVKAGLPGGGTGVDNAGVIRAAQAQLTAAGGNLYALAVSDSGLIEATGIASKDGRVVLTSGEGDIRVSGSIRAHDAGGDGGTILVGGGARGVEAGVPDAADLTVAKGAVIDAGATGAAGSGGRVVLWSDGRTDFAGTIAARGGAAGGNGGTAEVSGKGTLAYLGAADLRAPHGSTGRLLLDPDDVAIDTSATAVDGTVGSTTTITAATLDSQLRTAAVTIQTNASISGGNGDISFLDSSGANTAFATSLPNALTIQAARNVNVDVPIQITASSTGGSASGSTAGAVAAALNVGALTVHAGGDIAISQPVSLKVTSTGGDGGAAGAAAGAAGGQGGNVTAGGISFSATGNISDTAVVSIEGDSLGGNGGASSGSVAGGNAGAGGTIGLGAISLSAGGTLNIAANDSLVFKSTGGAGGTGAAGGNGGAGGTITGGGMSFSAADTTTGLTMGVGLAVTATSTGGKGGAGASSATPVVGTNAGGSGGAISTGDISLVAPTLGNAPTLGLNGGVTMKASTAYGTGGLLGGGTGGNGGNITDGTLSLDATAGSLYGEIFNFTSSASTSSAIGGSGGAGASGTNGAITPGAATFKASQNIELGNPADPINSLVNMNSAGDISLIAGGNLQFQTATLRSATSVTLVADNAHPAAPGFGPDTVSLDTTSSITAPVERVFAVSPSYVSFGSWAAPAVIGTGAADYYGQPNTGGSGVYYKVPPNGQPLGITADNIGATYGQAFPAFTASYSGLVNGDTGSVVTGLQFATSAHIGSNVGSYTLTPYGATVPSYYTASYSSGTLTINPATLTVTANAVSSQYGQATPTPTDSVTGLYGADASLLLLQPYVTALAPASGHYNAGTYTINAGATLSSSNYTLNQVPGTLTVTAAPLTVTANNASMAQNATALPALADTVTGLVNGDAQAGVVSLNPSTTATVGANAGTYTISPGATLLGTNYALTQVPGTFTILAPSSYPLDITANNAVATYGQAFPAFTASYSGFINGDTGSAVTGLQFSTTAHVGSNVGSYTVTPFGATAPSYYTPVYQSGTLTIHPATLTVTAGNASTTYGTAAALSDVVSGLYAGDAQAGVVSLAPTTTATTGSNVGTYAISPGATLLSSNYTLNPVGGTLTINPAPLTVTADNVSATYGSTSTYGSNTIGLLSDSVAGLMNGDSAASVLAMYPAPTAPVTGAYYNAGTYAVAPNAGILAGVSNYTIARQVNGTLTVNPAVLTVTAGNGTWTYGQLTGSSTVGSGLGGVSGMVAGDSPAQLVSLSPHLTTSAPSSGYYDAGQYAISPGATLLSSNYTLKQVNGTATVDPAPLTISVLGVGIVRGDVPGATASAPGAGAPVPTGAYPSWDTQVLVSYQTQYSETASVLLGVTGLVNPPAGSNATPLNLSAIGALLQGSPGFTTGGWNLGTLQSGYTNVLVPSKLAVTRGTLQSASADYTISNFSGLGGAGALIPGVTVFNPTVTVGVPATYAWLGAQVPPVMHVFDGLRGSSAALNGKDATSTFAGDWGATSSYDPANPVSSSYTLTPTGPSTLYNGDGYGPYTVQYNPGTLVVLGADGSAPGNAAVIANASCSAGTRCQGIVEYNSLTGPEVVIGGLSIPAVVPPANAAPRLFGIPLSFGGQMLSAVEAYLQSQGLPSGTGDAYNWMAANGGNGSMAGALIPYIINEVVSLEGQSSRTPDQQAFVDYVEGYLASQKHAAAVKAWQEWNACQGTAACEGPQSTGLLTLFSYWSDQSTPTPDIMNLSKSGIDTSGLSSAQQTALAYAMGSLGGIAAGAAGGAALSSPATLMAIQPSLKTAVSRALQKAGVEVTTETLSEAAPELIGEAIADTAGGAAAIVGAAAEVMINGIVSFVTQKNDIDTLKKNATATSFASLSTAFGLTMPITNQIGQLEAEGVKLPPGFNPTAYSQLVSDPTLVGSNPYGLTGKQMQLANLEVRLAQMQNAVAADQMRDTTMLAMLMTSGSTYSFGASLPPQATVPAPPPTPSAPTIVNIQFTPTTVVTPPPVVMPPR